MNIPEQKTPIFAGQPYEIGVEQNGKIYTYILYDADSILERWSGDKPPISMNKNSTFINDSCKKIGEVKVDFDGTVFKYSKDQVKDKVMSSLASIDAMFNAYLENKAENDLKEQQEKEVETEEYLGKRFDGHNPYFNRWFSAIISLKIFIIFSKILFMICCSSK